MVLVPDTVELEIGPQRLKGLLGGRPGGEEPNRLACGLLRAPKELIIVEGASHLFEEPGTLDDVQRHAMSWFLGYLAGNGGV